MSFEQPDWTISLFFFKLNSILEISSNTTIDTPSTAAGGYTNYAEIKVTDGNTLTISSGDEFKLNVLGIGTLSNY